MGARRRSNQAATLPAYLPACLPFCHSSRCCWWSCCCRCHYESSLRQLACSSPCTGGGPSFLASFHQRKSRWQFKHLQQQRRQSCTNCRSISDYANTSSCDRGSCGCSLLVLS